MAGVRAINVQPAYERPALVVGQALDRAKAADRRPSRLHEATGMRVAARTVLEPEAAQTNYAGDASLASSSIRVKLEHHARFFDSIAVA